MENAQSLTLVVRRTIRAPAERLFTAWTDPAQLVQWWGPKDVTCPEAVFDLRPGGRYRIANRFPNGTTIWIAGEFVTVTPPRELTYTWRVEPETEARERVTVRFEPRGSATEVIVTHERIASAQERESHEAGWEGCLDGLAAYVGS